MGIEEMLTISKVFHCKNAFLTAAIMNGNYMFLITTQESLGLAVIPVTGVVSL